MGNYTTGYAYSWGFVTCLLGMFTLSQWALILGIASTLITFFLNWYYRYKEYRFRTRVQQ